MVDREKEMAVLYKVRPRRPASTQYCDKKRNSLAEKKAFLSRPLSQIILIIHDCSTQLFLLLSDCPCR